MSSYCQPGSRPAAARPDGAEVRQSAPGRTSACLADANSRCARREAHQVQSSQCRRQRWVRPPGGPLGETDSAQKSSVGAPAGRPAVYVRVRADITGRYARLVNPGPRRRHHLMSPTGCPSCRAESASTSPAGEPQDSPLSTSESRAVQDIVRRCGRATSRGVDPGVMLPGGDPDAVLVWMPSHCVRQDSLEFGLWKPGASAALRPSHCWVTRRTLHDPFPVIILNLFMSLLCTRFCSHMLIPSTTVTLSQLLRSVSTCPLILPSLFRVSP